MSTAYDPAREPEPGSGTDSGTGREPAPRDRRPSVLHLVLGLVFLGLAGLWALAVSGAVDSDDTWLVPGLLVVAGAAGLVAAVAGGRRAEPDDDFRSPGAPAVVPRPR